MVKRREKPQTNTDQEERINEFVSGADGAPTRNLEPSGPRTHKKINVPFNEYEFQQLEKAASRSGRSKLSYLRWAMLEQAKRDLDG